MGRLKPKGFRNYATQHYYSNKDNKETLSFSQLLPPRAGRIEKVYTFIPLLHLENQQKVETTQEKAFEEIYVKLLKKGTEKIAS